MSASVFCVVSGSLKVAQLQAAAFVEGTMTGTVRITRRMAVGALDYTTGLVNDPETIIYEGIARIGRTSGANQMLLGDDQEYFASVEIAIPLAAAKIIIDDMALILTGVDSHSVNRSYRVADVTSGGDLPVDQSFTCVGVAPSRGNS